MARSLKEANQELERLRSMYRSMPNHKDQAAVELANKIEKIKKEVETLQAGGGKKEKKKGGIGVVTLLIIALVLGAIAFAAAFFGGQVAQ